MSTRTTTKPQMASAVEILSTEISSIAREIEELPEIGAGDITNEQMMWMQHVDFCSQRLVEVSKLLQQFSALEAASNENLPELMREQANLEHVRKLFG